MENIVKKFFDEKASNWDNLENKNQEWLSNFIYTHVPLKPKMKVLDLGCGTGVISEIIYNKTNQLVKAMDLSTNMIEIAKSKHNPNHIEFLVENFYNTNIQDMDMVLCFNAYPHFVDVDAFARKAYEVLNDSGILVIIHNLSREDLCKCHNGISINVSRNLNQIDEETKPFLKYFKVIDSIDNDEMFKLVLKRK